MKYLEKLFKKKENPFYTIFRQVLPKGIDLTNSKVYHIKSFEYTDSNMDLFNRNKYSNEFIHILAKLEYNSRSSNVSIYYVINPNGQNDIYLIADPLELMEKEYVIEKYNGTFDHNVMELSSVEQIN